MEGRVNKPVFEIVVDDGRVAVPIRNKIGEVLGEFIFSPTDVGIIQRYNEVSDKLPEITKPLENVTINADGTANSDDPLGVKALNEATDRLFELFDYMFGGNMSKTFFAKVNPFSPVGGRFYCENALEKIGQFISQQHDKEIKTANDRLKQYTQGYVGNGNRAHRRRNKRRK